MFEFFRKYQRFFFFFITGVTILSFSFFGTYSAMISGDSSRKERVVARAIDGSELKDVEIEVLGLLLAYEPPSKETVFEKEFLGTGVAEKIAASYFDALKSDWQLRLERAKRFRPYEYPGAPFLSAKEVWARFVPDLWGELQNLQAASLSPDVFGQFARLYLLQNECPPEWLRRILLYQQSQYNWLPADPRLQREDLSLFNFHNRQDWFGRDVFELFAQFILNGAIEAKAKGICASKAEAELDLMRRFSTKEANAETVLRSMGVRKDDALRVWQKAYSFLAYFRDVGNAALVDDLSYRTFSEFAGEKAVLDVYKLPSELKLSSLQHLVEFETYVRLACEPPSHPLSLPIRFLSADAVEKRAPELVLTRYTVKAAEIDLLKIAQRVSVRDVWDWQLQDAHWDQLRAAHAFIRAAATSLDRFAVLEALEPAKRASIDEWSRLQIVDEHPEWIEQEFAKLPVNEKEIAFLSKADVVEGLSVQNAARLMALFEKAAAGDSSAQNSLHAYREKSRMFRFENVAKAGGKEVLSLAEAKRKRILEPLAAAMLEEAYPRLRKQKPSLFQTEGGDWKPFGDVKDSVARLLFADLFQAIDRDERSASWKEGEGPLEFYTAHRFHAFMRQTKSALEKDPNSEISGLWKINPVEKKCSRTSNEEWIMQQPFVIRTGHWSPVHVPPDGDITFFFLREKAIDAGPVLDQIQLGKATLAADAQRFLAERLLEVVMEKKAIVIPIRKDD